MEQIAALPYRTAPDGSMEVLLITSRETRRWVIPKGNPIRGLAPHQAAASEAFEEAGISGIPCPLALGSYRYMKRRKSGKEREATVAVYPLAFISQFDDWPERGERETRWFAPPDAARRVVEPELQRIIINFREPPPEAGLVKRALLWPHNNPSRGNGMPSWFRGLLPARGRFFDLFEQHAATLVAGADSLARLLHEGADIPAQARAIQDSEHEADDITREVLQDVRRIFVTPFDRSAITSLISVMDDAIDQMNKTAKTITLYGVTAFDQQMRDIAGILVEAARITSEAMPLLRSIGSNGARLHDLTARLIRIEGHADELHGEGLRALLQKHAGDAMAFIVRRELYDNLERAVDRFEDIANEIQGLVIDHA